MKTFKEYGLPPSAAKGAKAHIKPLPKKEEDYDYAAAAKKVDAIKHAMNTKLGIKPKSDTVPKHIATTLDRLNRKHDRKQAMMKKHNMKAESVDEAKIDKTIYYKVNIEGLPPLYLPGTEGVGKIKSGLRKILKRPDMVSDMERQTGAQVRKAFRMMGQGKDDEPLRHVREAEVSEKLTQDQAKDKIKKPTSIPHHIIQQWKAKAKKMKEAVGPDDADDKGEYDYEGEMAKNQLTTMIDAATELKGMLGDDDNLPEWVQSKITKATDYIDSVRDYLKSESES